MRGYRRKRRMQKRKMMMRNIFMTTFIILFAAFLYTMVTIISPAVIAAQITKAYYSTRMMFGNAFSSIYTRLDVSFLNHLIKL